MYEIFRPEQSLSAFNFLTPINFFKDEVESVGLFKVFDELNYIFVTLAMVERLNLLQHTRPTKLGKTILYFWTLSFFISNTISYEHYLLLLPRMSGHLVNDLDGKLLVRPDILARTNWRISSLAKYLTG